MSPSPTADRQDARRRAASPYARSSSSSSSDSIESTHRYLSLAHLPASSPDLAGFPTRAQYKDVEATYIESLHPKKRDKSLITQQTFDRIWNVLQNPNSPRDTSQFRYWARKTFALSRSSVPSEPVVLIHDDRPVVVAEQLYEVLCYCHARADHGGRDRTLAVIREHYSRVPKRLTALFVAACPTCNVKKCGGPKSAASVDDSSNTMASGTTQLTSMLETTRSPTSNRGDNIMSLSDLIQDETRGNKPAITSKLYDRCRRRDDEPACWPPTEGPLCALPKPCSQLELSASALPSIPSCRPALVSPPLMFSHRPTVSLPMSREVSLFDGMPNGMRYMPSMYDGDNLSAYEALLHAASAQLPESKRPRIPSVIVPKRRSTVTAAGPQPDIHLDSIQEVKVIPQVKRTQLPPLIKSLSEGILGRNMDLLENRLDYPASLPESLTALRVNKPQAVRPCISGQRRWTSVDSMGGSSGLQASVRCIPQIDHALLFHGIHKNGFKNSIAIGRTHSDYASNTTTFLQPTDVTPPTALTHLHKLTPAGFDLNPARINSPSTTLRGLPSLMDHRNPTDEGNFSLSDNVSSGSSSSSVDSGPIYSVFPMSSAGMPLPSSLEGESTTGESQFPMVSEAN